MLKNKSKIPLQLSLFTSDKEPFLPTLITDICTIKIEPINKFILLPGEERELYVLVKLRKPKKYYNYIYIYLKGHNNYLWKIRISCEGIIPIISSTTKSIIAEEKLDSLQPLDLYPNQYIFYYIYIYSHYDYLINPYDRIVDISLSDILQLQEPNVDNDKNDIDYLLSIPPAIIEAHRIFYFLFFYLAPLVHKNWYNGRYNYYLLLYLIENQFILVKRRKLLKEN